LCRFCPYLFLNRNPKVGKMVDLLVTCFTTLSDLFYYTQWLVLLHSVTCFTTLSDLFYYTQWLVLLHSVTYFTTLSDLFYYTQWYETVFYIVVWRTASVNYHLFSIITLFKRFPIHYRHQIYRNLGNLNLIKLKNK
jgi:hypothetical protein